MTLAGMSSTSSGSICCSRAYLPDQAVVVAELLDDAVADAVAAAVADVADPGALGAQQQGGAGRAHALELAVLLAAGVDAGVGLDERPCAGPAAAALLACLW